jgi:hypothetical protein
MAQFRRKLVFVEAVQYQRESELPVGVCNREDGSAFLVHSHGIVSVYIGDWIVADATGRRWVVENDTFDALYEKVA